jgi:polysaccharide biosynthesis/export protein
MLADRIDMGLCGIKQDESGLKLQELAAYISPSYRAKSQSSLPHIGVKDVGLQSKCSQKGDLLLSHLLGAERRRFHGVGEPSGGGGSLLRMLKHGSYSMKGCFFLAVILATLPGAGMAQAAQSTESAASASLASAAALQAATPATMSNAGGANYAGPVDASRYVIGPQDSLQVTVWKEPTLSGTIPVRPDGMISLVLVGDMPAAGLTPMALGTDISQRLKKYIQDPVVTVVVLGVNSQRIFLVGEVMHVGPLMLTPGMTALQAVVSAGGLTQFASSKRIYILRTVAGKQQKIPFNYKQALKGDNQGVSLLPGDTIVVP